ncbi:DEAD/DEAH box helicase [Deinococcus marmoris]|uniref:DEAD/DEAH box helicase n=1 Tax=Deinococcus marmoris TaxID=249408 RepID=UPI000497FBFA|nr:AAA domain-containing protein [Deinococcus marmoris]
MPTLQKKSLSLYFKNRCDRQLLLYLHTDDERAALGMPERQQARPGLGQAAQAGHEYQAWRVGELVEVLGDRVVHGEADPKNPNQLKATDLRAALEQAQAYSVIVEGEFEVPESFLRWAGVQGSLQAAGKSGKLHNDVRPDLTEVLPSGYGNQQVTPDGRVVALLPDDGRLQLRVVDIKLASEPGANYFGEVAYYSVILASALEAWGLEGHFVVLPQAALWPGSYDNSEVVGLARKRAETGTAATPEELFKALHKDFEEIDIELFTPRIVRFLREDLPRVLTAGLGGAAWHPSYNCMGCEFYGHDWQDAQGSDTWRSDHCKQLAAQDDGRLSRVYGLTRSMALELESQGVTSVSKLATLSPQAPPLKRSGALRANAAKLVARAQSLNQGQAVPVPGDGLTASMPAYADLKIWIDIEYDPSTAITGAFGIRAGWFEPREPATECVGERGKREWGRYGERLIFLVERKDRQDLSLERERFLIFLRTLKGILTWVKEQDDARLSAPPTCWKVNSRTDEKEAVYPRRSRYQIYLWDEAQQRHLQRLVGRHLEAVLQEPELQDLAWLFPSGELLQQAEDATRAAPLTIVQPVLEAFVAVPVPHHYTLMSIAPQYNDGFFGWSRDQRFYDELSSLLPPERIHEIWDRGATRTEAQQARMEDTLRLETGKKLDALEQVQRRLERDLRVRKAASNSAAPSVGYESETLDGVSEESQLWFQYHRLNAAMQQFESEFAYCLPAAERVAKFKGAELKRLRGPEAQDALNHLNRQAGTRYSHADVLVFCMTDESRDVNLRLSDIGLCLSPTNQPGFLMRTLGSFKKPRDVYKQSKQAGKQGRTMTLPFSGGDLKKPLWQVMNFSVSIELLDRRAGLVLLKPFSDQYYQLCTLLDFNPDDTTPVMLDRLQRDFFAKKIRITLKAMGVPENVTLDPLALRPLNPQARGPLPRRRNKEWNGPWVDFLWRGRETAQAPRLGHLAKQLQDELGIGAALNSRQADAWRSALTQRLTLIWGPPGTGKSKTLRSILKGVVREAELLGEPRVILVTANTYTAVDNVLLELLNDLNDTSAKVVRVQREGRETDARVTQALQQHTGLFSNLDVDRWAPADEVHELIGRIEAREGILILGAPAIQVHNLAYAARDEGTQKYARLPWFDYVVIDEASQMDAVTSTLVFTKARPESTVVLAGDDKQLPPIHAAEKPEGRDPLLGSVYEYFKTIGQVKPVELNVNYRSNGAIVRVAHLAKYSQDLHAWSESMRLNLRDWEVPTEAPEGWPQTVTWSPVWYHLLDPDAPVTCVVYEDPALSGQVNDFEVEAASALAWILRRHLGRGALGRLNAAGEEIECPADLADDQHFWKEGLGVVAPHKAMVSKVAESFRHLFPAAPAAAVTSAVDTVERFQGQEREVMLAVFGLGDTEMISSEAEFLYDLRRFNVMASRARNKLIVFVTRALLDFMANDKDVLEQSGLLKRFAELYCQPVGAAADLCVRNERGEVLVRACEVRVAR